jgi:hypothetical protein
VCNDFGNNVPYSAYLKAFSQIRVPIVFPTAAPNLEPRDDIWPTEPTPVFSAEGAWGWSWVNCAGDSRRRGPRAHR